MRDVLNRVGIKSVNANGYESKFGLVLRVQKPLEIGGGIHALMTESINEGMPVSTDRILDGAMQALLTEASNTLGFREGEYTMFIYDIPNVPPSLSTVVMVAQANIGQPNAAKREHKIGVCGVVNPGGTGHVGLSLLTVANSYLKGSVEKINRATANITVIKQPKQGRLEPDSDGNWAYAKYLPDAGYLGDDLLAIKQDSFAIKVEGNGYAVTIYYFMAVTDGVGVRLNPDPVCKGDKGRGYWKISSTLDAYGSSTITAIDSQRYTASATDTSVGNIATFASPMGSSLLSNLVNNAGITFNLADLPNGALGQTTGQSITLANQ